MREVNLTLTTEDLVLIDYLINAELSNLHKEFVLIQYGSDKSIVKSLQEVNTDKLNRLLDLKHRLR